MKRYTIQPYAALALLLADKIRPMEESDTEK